MKITVGRHSGFCFGVKRAYDLALANSKKSGHVYILGKLVHNEDVCRELKRRGFKEIKSLAEAKKGTVIFTAHGVGPKAYERARDAGLKIIDATCPRVTKVQRLAEAFSKKNFQVLVFGDKKHKEVEGIREWSGKKAKTIESLEEAKKLKLQKNRTYCLISQTTQNTSEFEKIKNFLSKELTSISFFNTICDSTSNRQKEVRRLAKNNDAVIIIGGRESANSRRLYEISKKINPKTYFIENAKQLEKKLFGGLEKVAISAGASTPDWVIGKVIDKIAKID